LFLKTAEYCRFCRQLLLWISFEFGSVESSCPPTVDSSLHSCSAASTRGALGPASARSGNRTRESFQSSLKSCNRLGIPWVASKGGRSCKCYPIVPFRTLALRS